MLRVLDLTCYEIIVKYQGMRGDSIVYFFKSSSKESEKHASEFMLSQAAIQCLTMYRLIDSLDMHRLAIHSRVYWHFRFVQFPSISNPELNPTSDEWITEQQSVE